MQPNTIITEPKPNRHVVLKLIVGVVILTIIAAVSFFIMQKVHFSNLQNDVKNEVIKQNKILKSSAVNKMYKQTLPTSIASTNNVKISAIVATTGTSYCLAGTSKADTRIAYHMDENTPVDIPAASDCNSGDGYVAASVPGDFAISSAGLTYLTLKWSAGLYATSYTTQCALDTNFTAGLHSKTLSDLSATIDNLASNSTYYCRVAASNSHGQSVWSPSLQGQTNLYAQPPANMKADIVSSTELSYGWDAVPGAQYYILQYTTDINFVNDVTSVQVTKTSGTITGLQPYTGYFFRSEPVTGSFDQTHAAFSNPAFARTKKS